MNRREMVLALVALAGVPAGSFAQAPGKVWRIGMLQPTSMALNTVNLDAFLRGMQEHGHRENRNFVIDYRSADGRAERFPELVREMVRGRVDLIVTRGTPATLAARNGAGGIPVVTVAIGEPLLVVKTLARPGGSVTGLTSLITDLEAKRIELLKEIFPRVAGVGYLMNMGNPAALPQWMETERAARSIGIPTQLLDVRRSEDLEAAFETISKRDGNALFVGSDGFLQANGKRVVELALKHRLPAIYSADDFVDAGGLISYGVNYPDLFRRAASYVDKIVKGAKAGDLPMEQPRKFDLTINRGAAKALGISIPPTLLARADRLVD